MQLALENYEDDNGIKIPLIEEGHIVLGKFKNESLSMSSEEQLKIVIKCLNF